MNDPDPARPSAPTMPPAPPPPPPPPFSPPLSPPLSSAVARGPLLAAYFLDGARPSSPLRTLVGIVVAAALLNLALQSHLSSLAGLLSVVVASGLVLAHPARRTIGAALPLLLAVAAASNLVLRSSAWVVAPTVLAVIGLLVIGAQDRFVTLTGRRLLRLVSGWCIAILETAPFLGRPLVRWFGQAGPQRLAVARGLAVAVSVGTLLALLLANGDAVFSAVFSGLGTSSIWTHLIVTTIAIVPITGLAVMSHLDTADNDGPREKPVARYSLEALMGMSAMAVVLGGWGLTQLIVRLGGASRLLATENLTRAEYARQGFFELVMVVVVVLTLLATLGRMVGEPHRRLSVSLTAMVAALTLLLIAVTFSKLLLYVDAFGLTMLRLAVAWSLAWMAIALALVTIRLMSRESTAWLITSLIGSAALALTAFGWSNPEAFVVRLNVDRAALGAELDIEFLQTLGPDASPEIVALLPDSEVANFLCASDPVGRPFGPLSWNASRWRAEKLEC